MSKTSSFRVGRIVAIKLTLLAAACLVAAGGCQGFNRDWRASQEYAFSPQGMEGLWEGTWLSHKNGHKGKLRAIITRDGDNCYTARFHATYAVVIPYAFTLPMPTCDQDGVSTFRGEANLGPLAGGTFTYDGYANACDFVANYCAKADHGVFTMHRVYVPTHCQQ